MRQKKFGFETSATLKELLQPHFEEWKKHHGGDLIELASRCGVSAAYLSHVRRYGRIPSVPVLILLAFNFKLDGPRLFQIAGINEPFPYETGLEITRPDQQGEGVFSLRFNMEGFTETIRSIVRSEVRSRSMKDLLGNRPLRIGLNYTQFWMFESRVPPANGEHRGLFPEFARMLGVSLQKEIEFVPVQFSNYIDFLSTGKIDMFGPTMLRPNLPVEILFSAPIYRIGISAVFRKRVNPDLETLPEPEDLESLRDPRYQIAVLRNSMSHLIVGTLLKRDDSTLRLCNSDEEALERLTMRGVSRPVHLFVTNSVTAIDLARTHSRDVELLFATREKLLDMSENTIAVRPDWPEVVPVLNEGIRFVQARGGFAERLKQLKSGPFQEVIEL